MTIYTLSVPTIDDNHIQFVSSNFQLWIYKTYILYAIKRALAKAHKFLMRERGKRAKEKTWQ